MCKHSQSTKPIACDAAATKKQLPVQLHHKSQLQTQNQTEHQAYSAHADVTLNLNGMYNATHAHSTALEEKEKVKEQVPGKWKPTAMGCSLQ